jgi:hypothetical protein
MALGYGKERDVNFYNHGWAAYPKFLRKHYHVVPIAGVEGVSVAPGMVKRALLSIMYSN